MIYITPYESLVFLWRPNTLVKLVGCWRYWTVPSVAILLSWSLRFEVGSCWWGTCCYSCFFWCRSCRKKIAKSVIPPNLGRVFWVEQMFWMPWHRWPRDFFILFSVKCTPHSFPSCHFPFHHQRKTSEGGDAGGVVSACEAKNSSGLVSKYIYLYLLTFMKNPTNRFISIHFGARK